MNKIKNMVDLAMKKANLDRFSFAQMTSNHDGKTSGSGTMGVLTIGVGLLTFLMGSIHFMVSADSTIMLQSIALISIGTALLGYRKSKGGNVTKDAVTPPHDKFVEQPVENKLPIHTEEDMSGGDEPLNS